MNQEAYAGEVALINTRLAEIFARGSALRIALAQITIKALDEGWSEERHAAARAGSLTALAALRSEVSMLTARLTEIKR